MATTQTINSNYAGQEAGKFWLAAVKNADTIEKGVIDIMPNIAYKANLSKLDVANGTKDFACDFSAAGSVDIVEKVLTPKKLMINLELCKENFRATWEAESMGFSANNENLPETFSEYFIASVLEKQAAKLDSDIWNGVASNDGEFDGFLPLIAADTGCTQVTYSAITSANVVGQLEAVYDAIPDAILESPELRIIVSTNVAKAYRRALSNSGFRNDYSVGNKPLDFEGIELVTIGGLPAGSIVAYEKTNLVFGTGVMADHNELIVKDMADTDLSDNVRFKQVYTAGVQYLYSDEIVYHLA